MVKRKVTALAGMCVLAALLVAPAAQAVDPIETTMYAGGVLQEGTGNTQGSANVLVTQPDVDPNDDPAVDPDRTNDPVAGVLVRYFVGDREIDCGPSAITDSNGIARCGLLQDVPEILIDGEYRAVFDGDENFAAAEDTGSLIHGGGQELP